MSRQDYQSQLETLQSDVLYMGELTRNRLREALSVLDHRDEDRAMEIITSDAEINDLYLELEQDCIDLLALQQPVAGDLRFIAASFKIITDLERVADLATNLAEYSLEATYDRYPDVDIQQIGEMAEHMLTDAMAAYANEDTELCYAIDEQDDALDDRCTTASENVVRGLIEQDFELPAEQTKTDVILQDVSRLLLTIRDLERVGDHAVNIAARTLYMSTANDELIY